MARPYSHYAEAAGQVVWCMWGTGEPVRQNITWINDWGLVTCPRCQRVKQEVDVRVAKASRSLGPTPAAFPVNNPDMDGDVRVVYDRSEGKVIPFKQWLEKNKK